MTIEGLKYELKEILKFLEHPEPGLSAWHEMLFKKLKRLRSKINEICEPES